MSSKETIAITVLINAGLLLILFSTGVSFQDNPLPVPTTVTTVSADPLLLTELAPPPATVVLDEVDQVLQAWSQPLSPPPAPIAAIEPTSPQSPTPPTVDLSQVTVKKGDFLERIAKAYGASVQEIMDLNQLTTPKLQIGQVLKVPNRAPVAKKKEPAPAAQPTEYYTVKNGDNPSNIAQKHHMKLEELLKLNNLDANSARKLKPGDKLRIK